MIRVLVVDDSATSRSLLVEILSADADIEVIGTARDGDQAAAMARRLQPDLITMDIEMHSGNGFQATQRIMAENPVPIVIVTARSSIYAFDTAMDALRAGALTVTAKPNGPGSSQFASDCESLIETVKLMVDVKVVRRTGSTGIVGRPCETLDTPPAAVVAIASSTGGPAALHRVFRELPQSFSTPILVVQHISHGFIDGLARWLDRHVACHVKVAEHAEPLRGGTVYLAPDDHHLGVSSDGASILLTHSARIGGFRPSATYLFESVAAAFGPSAAGMILTGMGNDGVAGLRAVKEHDGSVIAEDESTCVVFGMPGSAIDAGLVDVVLPLPLVASRLRAMVVS